MICHFVQIVSDGDNMHIKCQILFSGLNKKISSICRVTGEKILITNAVTGEWTRAILVTGEHFTTLP